MPWTTSNPPSFAKNKSEAEKKVAAEAGNAVLAKGGSEEDAIFAAIAAVKNYNRKQSQQKAVETVRRSVPSHLSAFLNKAVVEAVEQPKEDSVKVLPIRKEFLGENALPTGIDRNVVSAEFDKDSRLRIVFDTGEFILTKPVYQNVENYVHISNEGATGGNANLNSFSISVNTSADVPLIVEHNLNLVDSEALMFSAYLNGKYVDIDMQVLDGNTVEILTYVDTVGLKLNFIGL